jgi:hypothetical protein
MIDVATKEPLRVEPNETAGPYLRVSVDQLPAVRRLLDERDVFYWVDRNPVVLVGRPSITFISFGHRGKTRIDELQTMLDAAS